jgi:tetratricopeptide (TPR) repeat protein
VKKLILLFIGIVLAVGVFAQIVPDGEFFRSLGDFMIKNGQSAAALSAYEKGLEVEPGNKYLLNNLGYYNKDQNPLLAEDHFLAALQIDPDYVNARNNLALLYNKNKEYSKSIEQLEILLSLEPENINFNYDIAINYANRFYYQTKTYEDLDMAISYFKKVYDMDPEFEHTLQNLNVLNEIRG